MKVISEDLVIPGFPAIFLLYRLVGKYFFLWHSEFLRLIHHIVLLLKPEKMIIWVHQIDSPCEADTTTSTVQMR